MYPWVIIGDGQSKQSAALRYYVSLQPDWRDAAINGSKSDSDKPTLKDVL